MSIFYDWFTLTNPDSPAPGTVVDPTIYLSLWSGAKGRERARQMHWDSGRASAGPRAGLGYL